MAVKNRPDEFYDDMETMLQADRKEYLDKKLVEMVEHACIHAPAVKRIFEEAGIKPSQIRTNRDLEKVPVIRKTDLIEMQKAEPPYGGFSAIPFADIERVFISPGPIYEPIQHSGIKWFAKSFWAAGFRKGDVVINTFTYHMSPAGVLFHEAIKDCGATVVVAGTGNTDIQVQTMRDLKVTGFVGTPSFLMTVIKRVEEMGYSLKKDFAIKKAWFTGEMLSLSVRKILEGEYNISTAQAYAVTEPGGAIAYECHQKSGMHFMDDYIIEIIDPATGKQLGPGEVGEIVVTPIHNKTWGLIRFGTGDLSSYTNEVCPCGRTASRLTGIVGRAADAVKVRGMFVVVRQAEQVISGFEQVSRFQLIITREGQRDEMALKLELKPDCRLADRTVFTDELHKKFQDVCRVKIDKFEFVDSGKIPEKHEKVVDQRKWE
ncbi:phenylacetate--CoA ligase family protein [Chloroflexota bacterium]